MHPSPCPAYFCRSVPSVPGVRKENRLKLLEQAPAFIKYMRVPIVLFVALATQLIDTASPCFAQIPTGLTFTLVRSAAAAVDQWQPVPAASSRTGRPAGYPHSKVAAIDGAHALSLFETREAALEIVRVYRRELPAEVRAWLELGLRRSPYRQDVIATMEKDLEAPDMPVTSYWIGTLTDLAAVAASPRSPDFARSYNYYYDRLAAVSERKIGPCPRSHSYDAGDPLPKDLLNAARILDPKFKTGAGKKL